MPARTRLKLPRCAECFDSVDTVDAEGHCENCAALLARWPGWKPALCQPDAPPGPGCQPTVLESRKARRGERSIRGACFGCSWIGPIRPSDEENEATEDAHDHTHPGWRELRVIEDRPRRSDAKLEAADNARIARDLRHVYPPDWPERHGPIRTYRSYPGTRHVPGYSPWGGYDLAVVRDALPQRAESVEAEQQALPL